MMPLCTEYKSIPHIKSKVKVNLSTTVRNLQYTVMFSQSQSQFLSLDAATYFFTLSVWLRAILPHLLKVPV